MMDGRTRSAQGSLLSMYCCIPLQSSLAYVNQPKCLSLVMDIIPSIHVNRMAKQLEGSIGG
jgi:hypothetical protein